MQGGKGVRQFVFAAYGGDGPRVQDVPYGLLLRKDKAAFGGGGVNGRYKDYDIPRL